MSSSLLLQACVFGDENVKSVTQLASIAQEIKIAVLKEDADAIMRYLPPSGTYFLDDVFTFSEIDELIRTNDSWLFQYLFTGSGSVKKYFESAMNLDTKIYSRDGNSAMVSYSSSNHEPVDWIESCFIWVDGKWYLDGIFVVVN